MGHRRLSVVSVLLIGALAACSGGGAGVTGGSPTSGSPAEGAAPSAAGGAYGGGGGGPAGAAVPAGGDQCGMLTQADWAAAGVTDATTFTENNSPPDGYYCVYRGKSSATGGIEMDVFISPTAADSGSALDEMFGEYPASSIQDVSIPGADKAQLHLPTSDGGGDPALIGVEAGKLAFGIGMGSSLADAAANGERLRQLAALVVARGAALTK